MVKVSLQTIETHVLGDNRLTCQRHQADIGTSQQPLLTARSTIWRRRNGNNDVTRNKWFDHAMYTCNKFHRPIPRVRLGFDSIEVSTPTHALHNDRQRLVKNLEHFTICNHDWAFSTMSDGACTRDSITLRRSLHNDRRGTSCHRKWIRITQTSCLPWTPDEFLCT